MRGKTFKTEINHTTQLLKFFRVESKKININTLLSEYNKEKQPFFSIMSHVDVAGSSSPPSPPRLNNRVMSSYLRRGPPVSTA